MSQTDPYSPPQSSLGGITPSEQHAIDNGVLRYSGIWQRIGAALIDFVIVLPLLAMDFFFGSESRYFQLYMLVPIQMATLFLHIYMVVKFGGTPGKLLMGLRIAQLDGAAVTVKHAVLRYGVLWALGLVISILTINAALGMTDAEFLSLSYLERTAAVGARVPFMTPLTILMNVWIWGGVISALATHNRRALHDFVAGTVVLRK